MNKLEMASMDIDKYLVDLRAAGATGSISVKRAKKQRSECREIEEPVYEGLAALMFLRHCWRLC